MEEIRQWIEKNREAFVKDLKRLVAIPSVSVREEGPYPFGKACADVLREVTDLAAGYGFAVANHEGYCGSCLVPGTSAAPKRIGFFAHLDVVPLGEGWQYPPLSCTEKDGYLIGRGVGDNKGPAVCALYALRFLKEQGIRLNNDVLLYFGLAEETGMQDIDYFCKTQQIPDLSLVTDTNFPVCYGEKGLLRVEIEREISGNLVSFHGGSVVNVIPAKAEAVVLHVTPEEVKEKLRGGLDFTMSGDDVKIVANGISAHAAFPKGAVNAIGELSAALAQSGLILGSGREVMEAVAALTGDFYGEGAGIACEDEQSGRLTCAGSVVRVEEGRLILSFDIRYPVTVRGEEVERRFTERIGALGFSVRSREISPPAYVPLDTPVIQTLCGICDTVLGRHYEPYTMGGGTYSRHLPFAVGFGPGIPDAPNPFEAGHGQGHQPDECIPLSVLLDGVAVYIHALLELDEKI